MPCLSLQRIAFQLHFVGRCVKRSFPSLPCHLPLPHRLILVHLLWRTLFYFLFPLKLFYLQRERRATPSLFGNPSQDARLYYDDFSWTHFSYVVVFLLSLSLLPFVIFMILFPPLSLSHNSWYAAASATVACFCCLLFCVLPRFIIVIHIRRTAKKKTRRQLTR